MTPAKRSLAPIVVFVACLVVGGCSRPEEGEGSGTSEGTSGSTGGGSTGGGSTSAGGGSTSTSTSTSGGTSAESTGTGATSAAGPVCGDGVCEGEESCAGCPADCEGCAPGACSSPGGRSCGGEGIGGDPEVLYRCEGGVWQVDHACGEPCEVMPAGVPDRCPGDLTVPEGLVDAVDAKPYVEGSCGPGSHEGWPFAAKECTYSSGGLKATVTVANPPPARVAAWIVDASSFIPTLWALKGSAPAAYEEGVVAIAAAMMGQSSRIFPLHGGIIEDLGGGAVVYPFFNGVTEGCSSGCYCRINSLHRTEWCGFREFLGAASYDDCIAEVGSSGLTAAWGARCLQNHVDAWESGRNEHFRAKAWEVNTSVKATCPSYDACSPAEVVAAVKAALG